MKYLKLYEKFILSESDNYEYEGDPDLDGDLNGHGRHSCKTCSKDMIEGWVVDGDTYCSEECRRKDYSDEEYEDKYDSDDSDEAYWTQWF